jgi:protease-4
MNDAAPANRWRPAAWFLFVIAPLATGILLSLLIPRPLIGVIRLNDAIYDVTSAEITQLQYAQQNPRIRAVVLVLNTPGGGVTETEAVYMEMARLRQTKPVITLIETLTASGGYYLAAGSDYILAKPSSEVGNIGVIGMLPDAPFVIENVYSTGPYKLWGYRRDTYIREMEMTKQGFLQAVIAGRGKALKADPSTILSGQVWPGAEAQRLGLIDELGGQSRAFEKAAQMAKIAHYRVEDLRVPAGVPEPQFPSFFKQTPQGEQTEYPQEPGIYMLYIPSMGRQP